MSREGRARMTETFVAVRDALQRSIVPTVAVSLPRLPDYARPWYLPEAPAQTPAQYGAALAKLGKLGIVKVN